MTDIPFHKFLEQTKQTLESRSELIRDKYKDTCLLHIAIELDKIIPPLDEAIRITQHQRATQGERSAVKLSEFDDAAKVHEKFFTGDIE